MEFNNNITEDRSVITFIEFMKIHMNLNFREDRRKKEVEDLISKYAKKKDKDEVMTSLSLLYLQFS